MSRRVGWALNWFAFIATNQLVVLLILVLGVADWGYRASCGQSESILGVKPPLGRSPNHLFVLAWLNGTCYLCHSANQRGEGVGLRLRVAR